MSLQVSPIELADVESFRHCLDSLARGRRFLALTEAPPLDQVRAFVAGTIASAVPQVVAREGGRLVGWCDMLPGRHQAARHCGSLGMGLLLRAL